MRLSVVIEALGFVRVIELRPCPVHFHTVHQSREGDFQPDGQAGFFGDVTILGIHECSTTKGDDGLWVG